VVGWRREGSVTIFVEAGMTYDVPIRIETVSGPRGGLSEPRD
jgi:hypothetical protein